MRLNRFDLRNLALRGGLSLSLGLAAVTACSAAQTQPLRAIHSFGNGHGWASDGTHLLTTADNGGHWRDITPAQFHRSLQRVFFLDASHGWVVGADPASSDALQIFDTADGGATWTSHPPVSSIAAGAHADSLTFLDAHNGWLMLRLPSSSNFSFGRLLVTHDGGASWQRLPDPPSAGTLTFSSRGEGVLTPTPGHVGPFVTFDGGIAWQRAAQPQTSRSDAKQQAQALLGNRLAANESVVRAELGSDGSGWILAAGGACKAFKSQCSQHTRLFAVDAQGRVNDITPATTTRVGPAPNLVTTSGNQKGFDKCAAATASQTNAWWSNTPWSWVNIYIGGENRGCSQGNLTSGWVSSVLATGFTLVPTWVGPQAPGTGCQGCSVMSSNTSTAYQQGIDEANAATSAANALGLHAPTIVYYDMENYSPSNSAAANAFVSGWVKGMRDNGNQAGVYGSPYNITYYAGIANVPNAVWLASWNGSTSVFGISGISDSVWANHQRLHQYAGGHDETWNGVTFSIDSNSSDGPVAAGDNCTVTGVILTKYNAMGGAGGVLGHCTTDTNPTANGGLYNHFVNGSIYDSQATGTHEVHGAISTLWNSLDWELGVLGYPISDETGTADGVGRYNDFEHGVIYWTPATNAHEVHGTIFTLWDSLRRERSCLGYPTSNEYTANGFQRNDFQHGDITWSSTQGAVADCSDRIFADGFGN